MSNNTPNCHRMSRGAYIVRTQAGFRKALKSHLGASYAEMKDHLVGYPREYPSMVFFSQGYRSYFFPIAQCVPLHTVREALRIADPSGEQGSAQSGGEVPPINT